MTNDDQKTNGEADEPKIVQHEVQVKLTEAELVRLGNDLAEVDLEILEKVQDAKDEAAARRKEIKDLRARSKDLAETVESGSQTRLIDCELHRDFSTAQRWLVRCDTGEEVEGSREIMTAAELQEDWLAREDAEGEDGAGEDFDDGHQAAPETTETQPSA